MAYLARPVANRGVHLRITPRPSNLGETREILRLLSQFGEIEYFKNLKYDGQGLGLPNIGLVIYKDEQGAKNCFRGSPVRFRMGKVKAGNRAQAEVKEVVEEPKQEDIGSRGGAWGLGDASAKKGPLGAPFGLEIETPHQRRYLSTTSSTLPKPPSRPIRMPFDPPSPPDTATQKHEEEDRIFQIRTSPTNRNFRDQINMGAFHSTFAIDSKMVGQEDLAKRVPVLGMSCVDWRAKGRPWRLVKREAEGRRRGERVGSDERLGVLWEREGRKEAEKRDMESEDALGAVEGGGERGGRRKWGMSWSDVGIR